jgi:hypothetical protein
VGLSNDPLYRIHCDHAKKAGSSPLAYAEFCSRLKKAEEQDLSSLLGSRSTPPAQSSSPKFSLGQLCVTANAATMLSNEEIVRAIRKHAQGDWGELCAHDIEQNERALQEGGRILSRYMSKTGKPFWIITEADRSVTTVLLPEDY